METGFVPAEDQVESSLQEAPASAWLYPAAILAAAVLLIVSTAVL